MITPLFAARLAEYGIRVYEIRPGIIATDMTFRILTWNKAARELYGLSAHDTLGRSLGEVITYEEGPEIFVH